MFRIIEKTNNAQEVFGKPKQCGHKKKKKSPAQPYWLLCAGYALSEQNTSVRERDQGRSSNAGKRWGVASVQEVIKLMRSFSYENDAEKEDVFEECKATYETEMMNKK